MEAKGVQIPTDPRGIVEWYSCDDQAKDCILGNCDACQSHGLSETDFITESNLSSNSDCDSIVIVILGVMSPSNSTTGIKLKVVTCLKCK